MQPRLIFLPLALLLSACPDNKGTTDTTTATATDSSGTATDTTVGMSSAPTTGDVSVTNSESADPSEALSSDSGEVSESSTASTGGDPTAEPTTGGDEIPGLCASLCMRNDECMLGNDPADCMMGCVGDLNQGEGECLTATVTYLGCLVDMTCAQLKAFFDTDDPGPCAKQVDEVQLACSDVACRSGAGGNQEGTECEVTLTCPDQPMLAMQCDTDTCQCLADGEPTGSCPADGVCMDLGTAPDKTFACCGF